MKRLALPSDLYSDVLGSLRQRRAAGKTISKRQERSAWSAYWDTMARRQESVRKLQIIEEQLALQKKTAADNLALGKASLEQRREQAAAQASLQRKALALQREIARYNRAMAEQKLALEQRAAKLAEQKLNFDESLNDRRMSLAEEQADQNAKAGTVKGITSLASLGLVGANALKGTELAKTLGFGPATTAVETLNAGNAVPLAFTPSGTPIIGGAVPTAATPVATQAGELAASALPATSIGAATPLLGGGAITAGGTAGVGAGVAGGAGTSVGSVAGSSLLPGLGIAAAPLGIVALAKLLSGNKPHDPQQAALAQFGTPYPDLKTFQDYLAMPESERKVDLLAMRDINGYMGPEYFDAWKQEASKAGLWDLQNNRWNTQAGVVDKDVGRMPTSINTTGWDTFINSNSYIPENQRAGFQTPQYPNLSETSTTNTSLGPMVSQSEGFGPSRRRYPEISGFNNLPTQTNLPDQTTNSAITAASPLMTNNFASQPAFSPPANFTMPEMPSFNMPNFGSWSLPALPATNIPTTNIPTTPSIPATSNNWEDWTVSAVDDIFGNWGR